MAEIHIELKIDFDQEIFDKIKSSESLHAVERAIGKQVMFLLNGTIHDSLSKRIYIGSDGEISAAHYYNKMFDGRNFVLDAIPNSDLTEYSFHS